MRRRQVWLRGLAACGGRIWLDETVLRAGTFQPDMARVASGTPISRQIAEPIRTIWRTPERSVAMSFANRRVRVNAVKVPVTAARLAEARIA